MATSKEPTRRVMSASKDSTSGLLLGEKEAALVGDKRNFVVVDHRGITLKGPLSYVSDSSQVREAGIFTRTPTMVKQIPSTIITPIPPVFPMMPVTGLLNLARDVSFFMSLLI